MKNLILAAAIFASTGAYASAGCPNFVGKFQLQDSTQPVVLNATQVGCTSVELDYTEPNGEILGKVYPLDNVRRQTYQDATMIMYETSGMNGNALQNLVEEFYIATNETITAVSQFYLDANNNLIATDQYYDQNGKLYHSESNQYNRVQQ